jgi:repressor LexA
MVGERLRALRESIGVPQSRIAELLGLSQSAVNRYENGTAEAPYKILLWYANYFDVSLDYIFERADKPQGKLFDYKPEILKEMSARNDELRQFVDMCFDPKSSINERLRETLTRMLSEGLK